MSDHREKDDLYLKLGVSSKKEEVHNAIKSLDKGLFPGAFCKIVEDVKLLFYLRYIKFTFEHLFK